MHPTSHPPDPPWGPWQALLLLMLLLLLVDRPKGTCTKPAASCFAAAKTAWSPLVSY
jgi:hypothetical protein